jgi:4-hydroxybenzoyl-CoA thioesterase
MGRTFSLDLAIDWSDCDPAGIVFYPQFFRMMNTATHAMFGRVGLPFHEMVAKYGTVGVPMLDVQSTFRSPAKFGDRVRIESEVAEWRDKTFTVRHVMKLGERVVFEAREVRVWAVADASAANGMRAVPVPAELKALFEG